MGRGFRSRTREGASLAASSADRREYARGEIALAYAWLVGFALTAALLEAVYLRGWQAFVAVAAAFLFNQVLAKTARLWTRSRALPLVPLAAWGAGVALSAWLVPGLDEVFRLDNAAVWALALAGIAGGVWPIARR